jgi:hypothetical protein
MAGKTNPALTLLSLLAALALAAGLAACGSSDSTTSPSTSEATTGQEADTTSSGQGGSKSGGGKAKPAGDKGSGKSNEGGGSAAADKPVHFDAPPLKVSGGGSKQFVQKGGDNSIQEFGDESDESELEEVAGAVYGFYVARAKGEWDKACSYLAKSNVESLEQLASQSPKFKDKGCGPILESFTRPLPPSVNREITTVDAGSFRHEGKQGFFIYRGAPKGTVYAMPMREEGGEWKVGALSGVALN